MRGSRAETGSGRVQPESARCLARDFGSSDRFRARNILTRPRSGAYRARSGQHRAENGQVEVAYRADRVDCLQYPAEIERVSGAPNVTRCIPIKLKYCDFSLQSSRLCTKL